MLKTSNKQKTFFFDYIIQVILSQNSTGLNLLTLIYANLCHWEKSMASYLKIEWRYSFAPVESGGRAKKWCYMQKLSFIAPWLHRAVFLYLLNLLCAWVQRSDSIFRADKSFPGLASKVDKNCQISRPYVLKILSYAQKTYFCILMRRPLP